MCFFVSLFPISALLALAYVVFYLAKRSEGTPRVLGRALGLWLVGLAFCVLVLGAHAQFAGQCPLERALGRVLTEEQPDTLYGAPKAVGARRSY